MLGGTEEMFRVQEVKTIALKYVLRYFTRNRSERYPPANFYPVPMSGLKSICHICSFPATCYITLVKRASQSN